MVFSEFTKTILPNGLTIVSERIPSVRSVSVGIWIKSGSRQENLDSNGVAHFVEHMLFKGTKKRSSREIARSLESVGGYLNAFTGKEQTCFFAEVLDDQLMKAIDVLGDMICQSTFTPKDFQIERAVILDEIDSIEDTPDDFVQDVFLEKLYPNHSLGFPILGSRESISKTTREQVLHFFQEHYTAQNIIISAAGNLMHHQLIELCDRYFRLESCFKEDTSESPFEVGKGEFILHRPVSQAHICLGTTALPYDHHQKYELLILNTILGVGMGSRLFQNIREKHGIAYSIYSFVDFFKDNGLMGIYLGTEKNKREKALQLIEREFAKLKRRAISQKELTRVKSQLKGNLLLGLENTSKRMSRLAKMEIYLQKYYDINQIIVEIDKVNQEGLSDLIHKLFQTEQMLQVSFLPN
jgi:predicted Zn-dependent peptidase